MIVRVTKKDIRLGIPGDPCNCPVAKAIKRTLHWKWVGVDEICIDRRLKRGADFRHQFNTPPVVRRFIRKFDEGKDVRHFWFYLPVKKKK